MLRSESLFWSISQPSFEFIHCIKCYICAYSFALLNSQILWVVVPGGYGIRCMNCFPFQGLSTWRNRRRSLQKRSWSPKWRGISAQSPTKLTCRSRPYWRRSSPTSGNYWYCSRSSCPSLMEFIFYEKLLLKSSQVVAHELSSDTFTVKFAWLTNESRSRKQWRLRSLPSCRTTLPETFTTCGCWHSLSPLPSTSSSCSIRYFNYLLIFLQGNSKALQKWHNCSTFL